MFDFEFGPMGIYGYKKNHVIANDSEATSALQIDDAFRRPVANGLLLAMDKLH